MALLRLCKVAGRIIEENGMLRRNLPYRTVIGTFKSDSRKTPADDNTSDEFDKPLKFRGSKAESWRALRSRTDLDDNEPWYKDIVISLSVTVFLLYFCVLREANDVDEALSGSLFDRIEDMEESELKLAIAYNKEHRLPTKELVARLKEVRARK